MNRIGQGAVLFMLGVAVLRASLTDLYLQYVRSELRPFLIAAGVVLLVAAIATLVPELRKPAPTPTTEQPTEQPNEPTGHPGEPTADDGHGHRHAHPVVSWLLVLPVFALLAVAPQALGADAATRTGTALPNQQPADDSGFGPLPAGDPAPISVYEYAVRAVFDKGKSLGTRRVQLTGFVSVGRDGERYLTRMMLQCCAADARPIKVGLAGQVPTEELGQDTWIRVVGRYDQKVTTDSINGGAIPYLAVESVEPITAPTDPYE